VTIFYRGPYALITHDAFVVRCPVPESYPVRELRSIQIAQSEPSESAARQGTVVTGAIILAGGAIPATVLAWQMTGSPNYVIAGFVIAAASATVGCLRPARQPFELQAIFRGRFVCLLRTTDERELGQVSRALLRAVERVGACR